MIIVDDNDYSKVPVNTPPDLREIEDAGMRQKISDVRVEVTFDGVERSVRIGAENIKKDLSIVSDQGLIDFIKYYTDFLAEALAIQIAKELEPKP